MFFKSDREMEVFSKKNYLTKIKSTIIKGCLSLSKEKYFSEQKQNSNHQISIDFLFFLYIGIFVKKLNFKIAHRKLDFQIINPSRFGQGLQLMPVKTKHQRKDFRPDLDILVRHDTASEDQNIDPRYLELSRSSSNTTNSSKRQLRHYHFNAKRTKIHLILDKKAEGNSAEKPTKRKRRVSYFLMSEQYKRKMSDVLQIPIEEQIPTRRKISWGEEFQYVMFNKNKSCQSIRQAPRHKFSIDQ